MPRLQLAPALILALALPAAASAGAQGSNAAHAHMGHVMESWRDTPASAGLLPTAIAEAEVAARHAGFAAADPADLDAMQAHAGHVLHALDPEAIEGGPGKGYGLIKAAEGAATHTRLAAEAEGASGAVKAHAEHVRSALGNVVGWAERARSLAEQLRAAETAAAAAEAVRELERLAGWIREGRDADGDGQISWREGEGGLAQAERHMRLMYEAEGLALE